MEFKFKREIAETLGLNNAVLLEYITNSDLQKFKIESLLKELNFWDENELMNLIQKKSLFHFQKANQNQNFKLQRKLKDPI